MGGELVMGEEEKAGGHCLDLAKSEFEYPMLPAKSGHSWPKPHVLICQNQAIGDPIVLM